VIDYVMGINTALAGAAALFFVRFWWQTRDRLFAAFAAAFSLLSAHWLLLALTSPDYEFRPHLYGIRLLAFGLIIAAVVEKNRTKRRSG
jgi:hypothetical protein